MKYLVVLVTLMLGATLLPAQEAKLQNFEEVMEQTWNGASRIAGDMQGADYVSMKHKLYNVKYKSKKNTFTAAISTTVKLDKLYTAIYETAGQLDPDTYELTLTPGKLIYGSTLPDDMKWSPEIVTGKLAKDSEHPGHYIIKGRTASMKNEIEYFELSTR